jgi:hypothetical protein
VVADVAREAGDLSFASHGFFWVQGFRSNV